MAVLKKGHNSHFIFKGKWFFIIYTGIKPARCINITMKEFLSLSSPLPFPPLPHHLSSSDPLTSQLLCFFLAKYGYSGPRVYWVAQFTVLTEFGCATCTLMSVVSVTLWQCKHSELCLPVLQSHKHFNLIPPSIFPEKNLFVWCFEEMKR